MANCFHCGDECKDEVIEHDHRVFCCHGCKTVYDILQESDLCYYYDLEKNPGVSPQAAEGKYDFLDNPAIEEKLLEFNDSGTKIVSFLIPSIHCSSCIWVLENLSKLHSAVRSSQVNFPKKKIRISFSPDKLTLKELVYLLCRIGYEPYISLENLDSKKSRINRSLIYKLGVAGFAFGNVMFLSFPEYFEVNEFWLDQFKHLFRWMMFAFSLPVLLYSAQDYFVSAFKGLRSKILNIDVPIALGISVLFIRSTLEISLDLGTGFFDSLTGLVFFLLLGKFFQQKTYSYLSFERDYRSYFPIAVTRLIKEENSTDKKEEQVQVYEIKKGDRILIRNAELIPIDAVLIKGNAQIDYSFVTGEAEPVSKSEGDKLYAGGRQQGGIIEIEALKSIEQSYLTQLWSDEVFSKEKRSRFQSLIDKISKRFTIAVLSIATISTLFWYFYEPSSALNVFTAVLIIACPCAIALASPFTLGNLLRIFGKHKLYLKEAGVIEQMASIDTVVFDKTGTITTHNKKQISYHGHALNDEEEQLLTSSLRASNHPLSRALYELLDKNNIQTLDDYQEISGKGIQASLKDSNIKIGSASFVDTAGVQETGIIKKVSNKTSVHISSNDEYKGCYVFDSAYRDGIAPLFKKLGKDKELVILSGDNDGEKERLRLLLPEDARLLFNQKPGDKLNFIKELQKEGKRVMMIGDGLNDAGALAQSDVGIAVSENINIFSPACDGILDASRLKSLSDFFNISNTGMKIIKWSFILSLIYNLAGLAFAVTGELRPVVAAILMPLSSISIVVFTSLATQWVGKRLNNGMNKT